MSPRQFAVIVEGPDGAGKTTLINTLTRFRPGDRFVHHDAYLGETHIAAQYLGPMLDAWQRKIARRAHTLVMDRSWLAEPIYGDVMRNGENRIATWQRRILERTFMGLGGVVVVCMPPVDSCIRAWRSRRHTEYPDSETRLRKIWDGYAAAIGHWHARGLAVVPYDYESDPGCEGLLTRLDRAILTAENPAPGAGCYSSARWALIGDTIGAGYDYGPQPPFSVVDGAECSCWLASQLEAWGVPETDLYWINHHEASAMSPNVANWLNARFGDHIVAFGKSAETWCEAAGVASYTVIHHPQYWKRFHSNETYVLKEIFDDQ